LNQAYLAPFSHSTFVTHNPVIAVVRQKLIIEQWWSA